MAVAVAVAVAGAGDEPCVTHGDQVLGGAAWAESVESGQRASGRWLVEPGEKQGAGPSEQPDEGVRRGSGLLPEFGDAPRRCLSN